MSHCLNNFSTTDIHILENGLRCITLEQDRFVNRYYYRLLRDHPVLNSFLLSMGIECFGQCLIRSLESIIREFRFYGEMITPLKKYWPEYPSTIATCLEPSRIIQVAETFIALLSQLDGVVWNPASEYTWRKANNMMMVNLSQPINDFSLFCVPKENLSNT